jgi:FtsZ-binding cell division protein ZapB
MKALDRIEVLLAEIEELDRASNGQFRQSEDREAHDIAARTLRQMRKHQNRGK